MTVPRPLLLLDRENGRFIDPLSSHVFYSSHRPIDGTVQSIIQLFGCFLKTFAKRL